RPAAAAGHRPRPVGGTGRDLGGAVAAGAAGGGTVVGCRRSLRARVSSCSAESVGGRVVRYAVASVAVQLLQRRTLRAHRVDPLPLLFGWGIYRSVRNPLIRSPVRGQEGLPGRWSAHVVAFRGETRHQRLRVVVISDPDLLGRMR